jgi:histidinol-phosphate aminotransferase
VLANYSIVKDSVSYILDERERLYGELEGMDGLQPFMSDTNFLIIRVADSRAVFQHLRSEGILVRNVSGYPMMEGCLRCNVGLREENRRLLDGLSRALR